MDNFDPIKAVHQLRAWVEESLSSLDTIPLAETKARYREIKKVIEQLNRLQIPISEDIRSEEETLEEMISTSEKREKLISLAKELVSFARDINQQLRTVTRRTGKPRNGRAPRKKLRVTFPEGTVVFNNRAVDTFVKSIEYMGLDRVSELQSVRQYGHPLVSTRKNAKAGNVRILDGYFIETRSSTEKKASHIRKIARALRLEISVDVTD